MDIVNELRTCEPGEHYHIASQLRQSKDFDWIIERLPADSFSRVMDVCCGSGKFLKLLLDSGKISEFAHGIDGSLTMLKTARDQIQMSRYGIPICIQQADILHPPELSTQYDLITLLSAIHWLYPHEECAYKWICHHIAKDGWFCITSYHPRDYKYGYAGTDWLVLDALERISLPRRFLQKLISIGVRTRPQGDIKHALLNHFDVVHSATREAKMTIKNSMQYVTYHWATFGNYYSNMVPDKKQNIFLNTLGEIAMERMELFGYVTNMDVCVHICCLKSETKRAYSGPS